MVTVAYGQLPCSNGRNILVGHVDNALPQSAAAPDLLEALEHIIGYWNVLGPRSWEQAQAAIAKAKE